LKANMICNLNLFQISPSVRVYTETEHWKLLPVTLVCYDVNKDECSSYLSTVLYFQ